MSKFTPGPWRYYPQDSFSNGIKFEVGTNKGRDGGPEAMALCYDETNARLIAAAPELYEALKKLVPITWNDGPLVKAYEDIGKQAEQALAKAEGKEEER